MSNSNGSALLWLAQQRLDTVFPDPNTALKKPNGLLAAGGDLSVDRLIDAYSRGIFPWYEDGQPILWWSPDPRSVLFPEGLKVARSLRKTIRKGLLRTTLDHSFDQVIAGCANVRSSTKGTWLTLPMINSYCRLHAQGYAHSVECWRDDILVGGLYGVALGHVFFGESMFSTATDASKVALVALVEQLKIWNFKLIDCQVHSPHLESLGAVQIPRSRFLDLIRQWTCADNSWNHSQTLIAHDRRSDHPL